MARRTRRGGSLLLTVVVALLATAAGASAAAPTAITGPVTAVGAATATVTGTVNPGGVSTTWYVEYGTTTSYGSKTTSASAGSGTANAAVSAPLAGLAQGTTYHYRVVATSTAGTSRGQRRPVHDARCARRRHRPGVVGIDHVRDAERHGRPERASDDLVVRVRHEHVVRLDDAGQERRHRHRACALSPRASRAFRRGAPTTTGWWR